MAREENTVVVIGLGEIGRPLYEIIREKLPRTKGVDLEPVEIQEPVGVMHLCVPHDIQAGFVAVTLDYARKYKPEIIVVNSTVLPGTTREIEKAAGVPAVYSPIRGKHVRMGADLIKYQKFVAGTNQAAVLRVAALFGDVGMKTATMGTPEALELAKLCETTYFGVLLGWAQEMERFAREVNADYFDVQRFFEEVDYLPRVTFRPGHIGGHCIMPNIGILKRRFKSGLLDAIIASNELKASEIKAEGRSIGERVAPLKLGEKPR